MKKHDLIKASKDMMSILNDSQVKKILIDKHGWAILLSPAIIYGIDKLDIIISKAIDNNYNCDIQFTEFFKLNLTKNQV